MKKAFICTVVFVCLILSSNFGVYAQDSVCSGKLKYARELFSSGQIEQIPSLLDSCLQKGFSKEEKVQAYKLMVQAYLFDYNRDKAEIAMMKFLQQFPRFVAHESDPVEFVELFRSFQKLPTWGFGFNLGGNLSDISVSKSYTTENPENSKARYLGKFGFDVGLEIDRYFTNNFWISFLIRYSMLNYRRQNNLNNYQEELIYNERMGWITTPLILNYSIGKKKFSPFFFAGGEFGYLLSARSDIKRHDFAEEFPVISNNSISVIKSRENMNIWVSGGLGLRYRINSGFWSLSIGYAHGLLPLANKSKRFSNNNMLYYYQYIDDDFKMNRYFCSVGFSKHLYKIKKKKADNAETNK